MLAMVTTRAQTTTYNQTDERGRQQGQWIVRYPARMGEDAYAEWGTYEHGVKWGAWYRFDGDAQVTAIEHFRNGVLDGEAKYFENGALVCVGHFRGLNPRYQFDTIYVEDPVTNAETRKIIPSDKGTVKHGLWRYYDVRTGRLEREIDYQLDEVLVRQDFAIAAIDSAYYKSREAAMPHNQKHLYRPPRDKRVQYTDLR